MDRIAVVLFNLGGPDQLAAVEPFLFNLFSDRAIINLPNPWRWLLAKVISKRRRAEAQHIYAQMGGKSPLLDNTRAQQAALQAALEQEWAPAQVRVFTAMRYWHPLTPQVVQDVAAFKPTDVLLLPLYPQFSTTTTGSSLAEWHRWAQNLERQVPTRSLCCYPTQQTYIQAWVQLLTPLLEAYPDQPLRVLFSAHGLPKRVVEQGDPYQMQIEATAAAIMAFIQPAFPQVEWQVSYQSRVGPLEWIGPATEAEIDRAGADKIGLVVAPIAFVSEHSETLVELDIQYKERAAEKGVPLYVRVPTPGTHPTFIQSLVDLSQQLRHSNQRTETRDVAFACGLLWKQCPCNRPY